MQLLKYNTVICIALFWNFLDEQQKLILNCWVGLTKMKVKTLFFTEVDYVSSVNFLW